MIEEERPPFVSLGQVVNVGVDLKRRLEVVARLQGADATYLARRILREQLDEHERANTSGEA